MIKESLLQKADALDIKIDKSWSVEELLERIDKKLALLEKGGMTNRNLGIFRVTAAFIENDPEAVAEIFSLLKIVPLKVEFRPDWGGFEYLAIGEKFEEILEGMKAPEYLLIVTKDGEGVLTSAKVEKVRDSATLKGLCKIWGVEDV